MVKILCFHCIACSLSLVGELRSHVSCGQKKVKEEEGKAEHVHSGRNSKNEGFEMTKILVHFQN